MSLTWHANQHGSWSRAILQWHLHLCTWCRMREAPFLLRALFALHWWSCFGAQRFQSYHNLHNLSLRMIPIRNESGVIFRLREKGTRLAQQLQTFQIKLRMELNLSAIIGHPWLTSKPWRSHKSISWSLINDFPQRHPGQAIASEPCNSKHRPQQGCRLLRVQKSGFCALVMTCSIAMFGSFSQCQQSLWRDDGAKMPHQRVSAKSSLASRLSRAMGRYGKRWSRIGTWKCLQRAAVRHSFQMPKWNEMKLRCWLKWANEQMGNMNRT